MSIYFYKFPIGTIGIEEENEQITQLYFPNDSIDSKASIEETPLIKEAYNQLEAYFRGELKVFSLSLNPSGTPFMKNVWKALCDIPYGETTTYKSIAEAVGSPKAFRAVGLANNRNPIPIIIPCHRVIGSNGTLIGYGGGLEIKSTLLNLEKTYS